MAKKPKTVKTTIEIVPHKAFAASKGVVRDAVGYIYYANIDAPKLLLESNSNAQNASMVTTKNDKVVTNNPVFYDQNVVSFYAKYAAGSAYDQNVTVEKDSTSTTFTEPSVYVSKVLLAANITTIEVRLNDPWVLQRTENSPYDFLKTIAITSAERDLIRAMVNNASNNIDAKAPLWLDRTAATLPVPLLGERKYYKATVVIKGTANGSGGKIEVTPVNTSVDIYSLDQVNWMSVNYVNAVSIPGKKWNNKIIPDTVPATDNPFGALWNTPNTGLKATLQKIQNEADNLPAAGTNKGYRLFTDMPIRQYIYGGDLDKVTFEMAFRLPFYIEKIEFFYYPNLPQKTALGDTPYGKVKATGQSANCYYSKFGTWFTYANALRSLSGTLKPLARTGLLQSLTNAIQQANDNPKLYSIFGVAKNSTFTDHRTPAYIAGLLKAENGVTEGGFDGYFTIPFRFGKDEGGTKIKLNSVVRQAARVEILNPSILINDGRISQATYNQLIAGTIVWTKLNHQSEENGYYICREVISGVVKLVIYNKFWGDAKYDNATYKAKDIRDKAGKVIGSKYWAGASGLTISYGYDMGGKQYPGDYILPDASYRHECTFSYITGLTFSGSLLSILSEGFNKNKAQAVAFYYTCFNPFFNNEDVHLSFNYAVGHILPFIQKDFLPNGVSVNSGLRKGGYFSIYASNSSGEFWDNGGVQYLNEVEKLLFATPLYNGGSTSLGTANARYLLHAFNTHDIRWAKFFFKKKSSVWRKIEMYNLLKTRSVYDHYNFKRETL